MELRPTVKTVSAPNQNKQARVVASIFGLDYIVSVCLAYESDCICVFSKFGKKIEWIRTNPKVCIQHDEIADQSLRLVDIVRIVRRTSAIDSLTKVTVLPANVIPHTSLCMGRALSLFIDSASAFALAKVIDETLHIHEEPHPGGGKAAQAA